MRERLQETRDILGQTDRNLKRNVLGQPFTVTPLGEWATVSFDEAMLLIEDKFHGTMRIRKEAAEAIGKDMVFHRRKSDIFYSYETRVVKND